MVLVTGGSGFIGTRLCELLQLQYGIPYRALVRNYTKASRIARLNAEMVGGDLTDLPSLEKAVAGCDAVVNLAYSESATASAETKNLVAACLRARVKKFIHISSIAVHGPNPGPECSREQTATISRYGDSYSDAKAQIEAVVQNAIRTEALPGIILRPGIVYGPYSSFVLNIVKAAKSGAVDLIDEGSGICNAVYVDDVCHAIHAALQCENTVIGHPLFIVADAAITWRDFNLTFARMANPDVKIQNFAAAAVRDFWASRRPTFRSEVKAFAKLLASVEFRKQLSTVPSLGKTIQFLKNNLTRTLPEDRVRSLKQYGRPAGNRPANRDAPLPSQGRLIRECFPIRFYSDLAKQSLNWQPAYDFHRGAELTRSWLEFARLLKSDDD